MNSSDTILSSDRLALFGYGIFETLLITEAGPLFADLHWQRMNHGAQILGLKPPNKQEWLRKIQEFLDLNHAETHPYALRITLSGGNPKENQPSLLLFHKRFIPYTIVQHCQGIQLHLLSRPRNEQSLICSIKSTNYLENILAKEEANHYGCEEGVWLNTQGYMVEGTMSNLFFVKEKSLFTPSLSSGCLPGTRRQVILQLAHTQKIPTYEGLYTLNDLLSSEEIFMTNSLMGIMPVRKIDDISFPVSPSGSQDSVMRCLELEYNHFIISENTMF
ncbi:branched-chain amino acid aminotransferase/4-amino-4-deoxychorismate lyase [Desulfosporosinus orientis DSM 765]|uniref:Branched-chain amino acid aminotransferase/4-amino-4-deoxychorismate lyase n=1 Tax=Desulfosporosinus orientis (strain ATCC 19365 / DSM 765 / NCIMB 8382 / VKM B-1628 / Singapore I) TaxID=768706 RepID=G7WDX8_DESOD|nr:aminotransferase class IV [Desulfosporosinus orientis]AET68885.1 branched-chain amino acid aminotransferase/4-amino-4-deoxychorismate lyase [Desulfosporosinus orientis DSM 765]